VQINVTGLDAWQKKVQDLPKQVRYAAMQAVNDTAKEVQKFEVETQLPSKLTLRAKGAPWQKPGGKYGVNIKHANRNTLTATVGSQADWLKHQEEGGTRTASSGHRLAVEAGARPSQSVVLSRPIRPRSLMQRKGDALYQYGAGKTARARSSGKGFIINTKMGPAIYIRTGGTLKLMYGLEQSAKIPAVLQFFKSAKELVQSIYPRIFNARLTHALKTAK
jgi:hypothetical protein